jgi:hypothetical protein
MTTTTPTRFQPYTLDQLFNGSLILDNETCALTLLQSGQIAEQQILTYAEFLVAKALFEDYPHHCPYEVLLIGITGKSVERNRNRLEQARESGSVDPVIRPLRNLIYRLRMKLLPFGINIKPMIDTGYVFLPDKAGMRREERIDQ